MLKTTFSLDPRQLWRSLSRFGTNIRAKRKALLIGAALLGMNLSSSQAQSFAPPIRNPWGLDTFKITISGVDEVNGVNVRAGDIDGDNDIDLINPLPYSVSLNYDGMYLYENTGTRTNPQFPAAPQSQSPFQMVQPNVNAVGFFVDPPTLTDVDGDGDLDLPYLQINTRYEETQLFWFENTGGTTNPQFATPTTLPFNAPKRYYSGIFGDFNGDDSLDMVAYNYDTLTFIRRDSAIFVEDTALFVGNIRNNGTAAGDLDRDGDLDILVANGYDLVFLENESDTSGLRFTESAANPFGLAVSLPSSMELVDMDGDGDLDIIASFADGYNPAVGTFIFQENTDINIGTREIADETLRLFPNPAAEQITLQLDQPSTAQVSVHNILGQEVRRIALTAQNQLVIDLRGLATGTYSVRLDDGRQVRSYKFFKQ